MHDRPLGAFQCLVGAVDQVLARLHQDLDGDVVGDHVALDDLAHEIEIGLRGGGEADLDLLEAHADEQLEHAPLAIRPHRFDQGLVAVAQIDRAPHRRLGDGLGRPGPVGQPDRLEGLVLVGLHEAGKGLVAHLCHPIIVWVRAPWARGLARAGKEEAARSGPGTGTSGAAGSRAKAVGRPEDSRGVAEPLMAMRKCETMVLDPERPERPNTPNAHPLGARCSA